jgi:hypothetical protein
MSEFGTWLLIFNKWVVLKACFNNAHVPEIFALKMAWDLIMHTIVLMQMMNLMFNIMVTEGNLRFLTAYLLLDLAPKIVK